MELVGSVTLGVNNAEINASPGIPLQLYRSRQLVHIQDPLLPSMRVSFPFVF